MSCPIWLAPPLRPTDPTDCQLMLGPGRSRIWQQMIFHIGAHARPATGPGPTCVAYYLENASNCCGLLLLLLQMFGSRATCRHAPFPFPLPIPFPHSPTNARRLKWRFHFSENPPVAPQTIFSTCAWRVQYRLNRNQHQNQTIPNRTIPNRTVAGPPIYHCHLPPSLLVCVVNENL